MSNIELRGETNSERVATIFRVLVPAVVGSIASFGFQTANIIFLSSAVDEPNVIAAVGLGFTTLNMMGYAILWGFTYALDTLISRSAGAQNHELSGVYLNRGLFYLLVFIIPVTIAIFKVEAILVGIGQD